jgi:hypothetical protein
VTRSAGLRWRRASKLAASLEAACSAIDRLSTSTQEGAVVLVLLGPSMRRPREALELCLAPASNKEATRGVSPFTAAAPAASVQHGAGEVQRPHAYQKACAKVIRGLVPAVGQLPLPTAATAGATGMFVCVQSSLPPSVDDFQACPDLSCRAGGCTVTRVVITGGVRDEGCSGASVLAALQSDACAPLEHGMCWYTCAHQVRGLKCGSNV